MKFNYFPYEIYVRLFSISFDIILKQNDEHSTQQIAYARIVHTNVA